MNCYIISIRYYKNKNKFVYEVSERVSDCCLTPKEQFLSYIMVRTYYIRWNDNEVSFVLDTNALLDFHSSLKQHPAGRHVASLGHIILIPSQSVFVISP